MKCKQMDASVAITQTESEWNEMCGASAIIVKMD